MNLIPKLLKIIGIRVTVEMITKRLLLTTKPMIMRGAKVHLGTCNLTYSSINSHQANKL
ncbi:hypothetical protein HanRHA438_Chr08g0360731 [Helianthus annuus]|nr:hypothetical protein HanRHA438_Chr08g0360731 [Helianthus annuus]